MLRKLFGFKVSFDEFIQAAREGEIDLISLYIAENRTNPVAINAARQYGNTALICAASNGHTEVVRLLIEAGAALDIAGQYGSTALIRAATNGHTEVVRLLVDAGAALDTVDQYDQTALILAAYNGCTEAVRLLLAAGAAINVATQCGNTALIFAADKSRIEAVRLLLAAGADPTWMNKEGATAEQVAANDEIRGMLREAMETPEIKLAAFEKKLAGLVKTQLQAPEDSQIKAQLEVKITKAVSEGVEPELTDEEIRVKIQSEKEEQNKQIASTSAFKGATHLISFLQDNGMGNSELLPDLLMRVSELLLSIGDKELEATSRVLIKLAAKKCHGLAQHIDNTFKPNAELNKEIQEEMEIDTRQTEKTSTPPSPATEISERDRMMQARLKTFGSDSKNHIKSNSSLGRVRHFKGPRL